MNLLLDTHVLIWWDEGRRLAASAWEIAVKIGLGRLRPRRTVEQAVAESGFLELPVTFRHAEQSSGLPAHHRDPFDRLLVAQAEVEDLTLVTRDPVFARYAVEVIEA